MAQLDAGSAFMGALGDILTQSQDIQAQSNYFIGLMSGTSMDGLDGVLCQFYEDADEPFEILAQASAPFDENLRAIYLALCTPSGAADLIAQNPQTLAHPLEVFGYLGVQYAHGCHSLIMTLLQRAQLTTQDIAAIGMHGQTLCHRPDLGFSYQLGCPHTLHALCGIQVVYDFRNADIAQGGCGAPLVPIFHRRLLEMPRAGGSYAGIVNIGGMANITRFDAQGVLIGYDIGAGNVLLDAWMQRVAGVPFDQDGAFARQGRPIAQVVDALLAHPFYAQTPPKSTGREMFNDAYLLECLMGLYAVQDADDLMGAIEAAGATTADIQASLTQALGRSILEASLGLDVLYLCGGGAKNRALIDVLTAQSNLDIQTTDALNLPIMAVEATAFAYLAHLRLIDRAGNVPSVTGARAETLLGQVVGG